MNTSVLKRVGIVLAALIPVAIVGAFVFKGNEESTMPTTETAATTSGSTVTTPAATTGAAGSTTGSTTSATTETTSASTYKDGTYTATGAYTAPDGPQSVTLTLTIADDVVTSASLVLNAKENTASGMWQEKFASGYSALVTGKNIDDLKLTKVSGSSLTPIGFNAAVKDIQEQAKG